MELLVLTKVGGFLGPFATIFGWIFNLLYILLDKIYGLPSVTVYIKPALSVAPSSVTVIY